MKKFKSIFVLALVALFATSCTNSLIKKYEKAAEEGDLKKANEILKKLDKKGELSDKQLDRLEAAEKKITNNDKISYEEWYDHFKVLESVDLTK